MSSSSEPLSGNLVQRGSPALALGQVKGRRVATFTSLMCRKSLASKEMAVLGTGTSSSRAPQ